MTRPLPLSVRVTRVIAAPPEVVYDLISDITRMPDYSTENVAGTWLDGATGPVVGARFQGKNALGHPEFTLTVR